jgi:acetylglutamate kinase
MSVAVAEAHLQRAETLVEALPYLRAFQGQTLVVKLGGAAIDQGSPDSVLQDVVLLRLVGLRPVLVHGGGPAITEWQRRAGIEAKFVNGLRVTDERTMEIAQMVLTGKVGPELVSAIHRLGGNAMGLSGEDGPILKVRPLPCAPGEELGYVGEVAEVDCAPINAILDQGRIPVIASIGLGYDGHAYNVNADTVAAEMAVALGAEKLLLMTDVAGVMDGTGSLLSELHRDRAVALIDEGVIAAGMIPKVRAALRALDGAAAAHIIDGRVAHALLLELLTEHGVGTMLRNGPAS